MHAEAFQRPAAPQDEGLGRALAWAVGVHLLVVAILLLSPLLSWDPDRISVAGAPSMEAVLDVSSSDQRAVERALAIEPEPLPEPIVPPLPEPVVEDVAPPPQPIPEPVPQEAPVEQQPTPQERVPEPAPVDQEEVRRDAEAERARVEREQEEKRRQEQIDLTERKKQEEAEQKRRLQQQQLEKIRAEREKLESEQRRAQERLQQIADREARQASQQAAASAPPPPGNQGVDTGLAARYAAALQEAILRNWTRPETVPIGQRCRIVIRQIPGGEVVSAEVDPSCPYDELGRRSVEAAVLKAQPLPYAGFESVFQRTLILNFTAQDR
ncbi:cell envelope integrity protein TolA [Luteimonas marina]|uniref:Cell envelope integrity protein TolA n=1 Tax=Luteimonas marina TaxID=488485 RepID=A0A5C5U2C2_9GAMM|nr:cell envelope integrity protein TolA [Luteimonas marina]TWT20126.1 cell envelope integrity protein TolA [Luteimonas marina]